MNDRRFLTGAVLLVLASVPALAPAADVAGKGLDAVASSRDAKALAQTIDRRLAAKWAEAKIVPVGPADDAEYLRRVCLDLVGKLPSASEARDFLDDRSPDKRAKLVERLLASPAYMARATEIWRQLLLPEADTDGQARFTSGPFEAWLRKKVAEEAGYDAIVREILTAKLGGRNANPYSTRAEPSPVPFYFAKDGKPENLAAGTARVFLGIRLECAQCHNHPFAKWKREEFWSFAAFFAGVQRQGTDDALGSIREVAGRRELAIPGTERIVKAVHLDGSEPAWKTRSEGRQVLSDWITSDKNPYFAKAAVNRVWSRFFGIGLVEPVDDMGEDNEPIIPELLDEMSRQFITHNYDLKYLIRAITATRAYGLTSTVKQKESSAPPMFSAMPVRGLSPGQLFDSLVQATGFREGGGNGYSMDLAGAKGRFLELFANRNERPTEAQTSILQALTLMNGQIVSGATSLEAGDTLSAVAEAPYLDTSGRIEELFLAALTRRPRPEELSYLSAYVDRGGPTGDKSKALADVFWAILNGPEFKHNH
ncbi:MAG: Protein of unknown function (DUF1553)/Protein of unknown function [Planctomycetota bacterium]|nr:Protein of unknown function (DUF1553)/Protein of unknown function [Planctomycetota bacterium]